MRTVEIIQISGATIGAFAAGVMAVENKLLQRLRKKNATSSERGVALPDLNRMTSWRLSLLIKNKAVRVTEDDLYFVDETMYRSLRRRRLLIAIPAMLAALALVVVLHAASG